MEYKNVSVRAADGTLVLQDGSADEQRGKMKIKGKLEDGVVLTVGKKYKITGEVGLTTKGTYAGSPGAGTFEFKIE